MERRVYAGKPGEGRSIGSLCHVIPPRTIVSKAELTPVGNGLVASGRGLFACRLADALRCWRLHSRGVRMRRSGAEQNFKLSSRDRITHCLRRILKRMGRRRIAGPNLEAATCMVESSPQALPKFQSLAADRTVVSHSRSRFSRKRCKLRGDDAPQSQKNALGSKNKCLSHPIGQKWQDDYPISRSRGPSKRQSRLPPTRRLLLHSPPGRSKCLRTSGTTTTTAEILNSSYQGTAHRCTLTCPEKPYMDNRGLKAINMGDTMRWGRPFGLLLLILLSLRSAALAREASPRFTASTLEGQTFTNNSLKGRVALLEFWTTWCPSCRSDQSALDDISREFSGEGLVVLAVDAYESGETVKKYLQQHPRSCNVVLNQDTTLIAAFKPASFPFYVLIDRDGNIAGTQDGAGGDVALLDLLSNAGLRGTAARFRRSSDQESAVPTITHSVSPKLMEAPRGNGAPLLKSVPPTVFVLKSGERLEAHRYTIMAGSLRIDAQGTLRIIPLSALDLKATTAADHERGIDLKIPLNQNEVLLGF